MNMYYVKIKPIPTINPNQKPSPKIIYNKKREKGKGLPPHLKQKPKKKKEILEWILSWNIWVPIKILCS